MYLIAASGTRFDGLDLLYLLYMIAFLVVMVWLLRTVYKQNTGKTIGTGKPISLNEADAVLKTDYLALVKPNLNATPYFLSDGCSLPKMWKTMDDEWKHGISETPMPTPFYDWANERPMPMVNW